MYTPVQSLHGIQETTDCLSNFETKSLTCTKASHSVQNGLMADLIPTCLKILCIVFKTPLIHGYTAVVSTSFRLSSASLSGFEQLIIKLMDKG